jgi:hypothetical protein
MFPILYADILIHSNNGHEITSSDLDHLLPGQVAYRCGQWSIRKIERLTDDNNMGANTR